jgi:hypothetical protein
MFEIAKEYDIKNINQNKRNNGNLISDKEVLESTKSSNQIILLVANRSQTNTRTRSIFTTFIRENNILCS